MKQVPAWRQGSDWQALMRVEQVVSVKPGRHSQRHVDVPSTHQQVPPLRHLKDWQLPGSITWSHRTPRRSAGHRQLNPPTDGSMHVPPDRHGEDAHGLTACSHRAPVNPLTHEHLRTSSWRPQVPPLRQYPCVQ